MRHRSKLKHWPKPFAALLSILLWFSSCNDKLETTYTYITQVSVLMDVQATRSLEVGMASNKELVTSGKIYVYGDYLLINEPKEGIHIFDNRNPSSPVKLHFIKVPGNVDLAVNSGILYADSYVDLLAFDISNMQNIRLVNRVEDVFPNMYIDAAKGLFVTYRDSIVSYTSPRIDPRFRAFNEAAATFNSAGGWTAGGGQSYGQGGSMARFTLLSSHLYAVDETSLRLFDVQSPSNPSFVNDILLGWGIETIFPYKDKLFIGSTTGMYIYDASTPSAPQQMSVYSHFTACDPVVVNDEHAFVTLRSGNFCQQGVNQLQVLDIRDLYQPRLLKTYEMQNPHGLGLAGNNLFICEGQYGLKQFNAADVLNIADNQLELLESQKSYDVIPTAKSLIVTGPEGVCQYDYSVPGKLRRLSCISIGN